MYTKIKHSILLNILKLSNLIIYESNFLPTFNNVFLNFNKNDKNIISIFSNEKISVKKTIFNFDEIEISGSFSIKNKIIYGIVSKLDDSIINLETNEENSLLLANKSFNCLLNLSDLKSFPEFNFNFDKEDFCFEINIKKLKEIIKKLSFCVYTNSEKISVLNGMNIHSNGEEISFLTTDSFKAAIYKIQNKTKKFDFVIEFDNIKKIVELFNDNEQIKIYFNENLIIVSEDLIINCKVLIGNYPNIENSFKIEELTSLNVNSINLISALERGISLVFSEKSPTSFIKINSEGINVKFKSIELGSSNEEVEQTNFIGEPIDFLINSRYFTNILRAFNNTELVIKLTTSIKPIILEDLKNPNFKQLILPMRIN